MEKLKMESIDITQKNIERIASLFPNVITEMRDESGKLKKGINFEKLKQELSGDVVDGEECFDFTWVGKKTSIVEGNAPIRKTLRPCIEESKDWEKTGNLYIEGDNLDVLKLLQESYLNSIKVIYIDPPYNTGSDSFVYPDNYAMDSDVFEDQIQYRDEEGKIQFRQNNEANPRFHSDWCSMLFPRLKLAQNLLTDDGVIFISINDSEFGNLKKLCDEVFGEKNFIDVFLWTKTSTPPSLSNKSRKTVEFILCYEKSKNNTKYYGSELDNGDVPLLNTGNPKKTLTFPPKTIHFTYLNKGSYKAGSYEKVELLNDIFIEDGRNLNEVMLVGEFKWGADTVKKEIKDGTYFIIKSEKFSIRFQRSNTNDRFKTPNNFFDDIEMNKSKGVGTNESAVMELDELGLKGCFDYPKPISLLKKLIKMITYEDKNCIVLDFFAGSSSTAQAVLELNNEDVGKLKFIMVQLAENLDECLLRADNNSKKTVQNAIDLCNEIESKHLLTEIGKERIRRVGEKIKADNEDKELFNNPDLGFRVLKVDSTNMKDVFYAANEYSQSLLAGLESNLKEDRSDLDLLYGVLLDWGLPLSLSHKMEQIDGVSVHTVDEGSLVACFAEKVSESVVREIAKRQPLRVVFRDSSFANSPDKINVEEIYKLLAPNTTVKVI